MKPPAPQTNARCIHLSSRLKESISVNRVWLARNSGQIRTPSSRTGQQSGGPAILVSSVGPHVQSRTPGGRNRRSRATRRQASETPSRASHCDDWTFGPNHHRLGGHIQPVDAVHANSSRASPPPRFFSCLWRPSPSLGVAEEA